MRKSFILVILIFTSLNVNCLRNPEGLYSNPERIVIQNSYDFFKQPFNWMALELARNLGISIISDSVVVSKYQIDVFVKNNRQVEKGYNYLTSNGGNITVWVDNSNEFIFLTYLLTHRGINTTYAFDTLQIESSFTNFIEKFNIRLQGNEFWKILQSRYRKTDENPTEYYFFTVNLNQKLNNSKIEYPFIQAQFDGESGDINFLKMGKWYKKFKSSSRLMPVDSLINKAKYYYENQDDILSVRDSLLDMGFYIMDERICKKIGFAILNDGWQSQRNLYIDAINLDLVCIENL